MRAALMYAPGDLRVGEAEKPSPAPDQVLVRIHACGVCPSDLRFYTGSQSQSHRPVPYIPGHEWAGVIEQVGADVQGWKPGDRVVADGRKPCGHCYYCGRGISNYCTNLTRTARGGFAQYGVAAANQLFRLPEDVSFEAASFAEPLACCINGTHQSGIKIGDDVVVVGTGPIGLLHIQLARAAGARVIAVERIASRLEMAGRLGANELIDGSQEDPIAKVKELTDGRGGDAVIVAVGGASAADVGLKVAGIGASVNLFAGTYPSESVPLELNLIHYKQLRLTGSHDYVPHHFRTSVKYICDGTVSVKPLISHYLPLDEVKQGFDLVVNRQGLKVMVQID